MYARIVAGCPKYRQRQHMCMLSREIYQPAIGIIPVQQVCHPPEETIAGFHWGIEWLRIFLQKFMKNIDSVFYHTKIPKKGEATFMPRK